MSPTSKCLQKLRCLSVPMPRNKNISPSNRHLVPRIGPVFMIVSRDFSRLVWIELQMPSLEEALWISYDTYHFSCLFVTSTNDQYNINLPINLCAQKTSAHVWGDNISSGIYFSFLTPTQPKQQWTTFLLRLSLAETSARKATNISTSGVDIPKIPSYESPFVSPACVHPKCITNWTSEIAGLLLICFFFVLLLLLLLLLLVLLLLLLLLLLLGQASAAS